MEAEMREPQILGPKAGVPVLIIDVLKGFAAVKLVLLSGYNSEGHAWVNFKIALCFAALLGHIFPLFVGFRGGKGVATLLGGVIAIAPLSAGVAVLVFVLVLLGSKYVSLSSMTAGLTFPFSVLLLVKNQAPSLIVFSIFVTILLIITHKKNIIRLIKKQESRFDPFSKTRKA
jgi:glycerol-3-phosphate acyltransferase PlsY